MHNLGYALKMEMSWITCYTPPIFSLVIGGLGIKEDKCVVIEIEKSGKFCAAERNTVVKLQKKLESFKILKKYLLSKKKKSPFSPT